MAVMSALLIQATNEYLRWCFRRDPQSLVEAMRVSSVQQVATQPRTQALFSTLLAGGETLVNAGHVAPRFWEPQICPLGWVVLFSVCNLSL
jgi:hypothetical protein